jgi:hypothetical protein
MWRLAVHESPLLAADTRVSLPVHPAGDTLQRVSPLDDAGWNAKLTTCQSASFFHSVAWARVLHDTYGFKPLYFTLGDRQCFHSLLPIMEVNSWLTGKRGLSLPFTDECEPLCPDAVSFRRLFQATLDCAKARGWKYVECRGGKSLFGDAPASASFFGHSLDLHDDEPALWARIDDATRRAVRKAEQCNLTVEFSQDLDAVRTFHDLLCQTRRRHGVPPQPFRFFQNIQRHVLARNQGQVVLVRLDRTPVAGAVFFHFGKTSIFKFGASDSFFHPLRVNNLMMWQAIKWHVRQGFSVLDFGRTSLGNEGLRRFKLNWGTKERRIDYVRYNRHAGGFVRARDESLGWYNRIFKILPNRLTRLVGAVLYKHIA